MSIISTKTHGILDYLTGIVLIIAPWVFNFSESGSATAVSITFGAIMIMGSIMTRYEVGAVPLIPMRAHLLIDILSGIVLALSPWLFKFSDYVYLPHLLIGLMEVTVALLTAKEPSRGYKYGTSHIQQNT